MLRILGVVSARGGSKRIPRKSLQEVEGVPLVVRAMCSARQAARLTRWLVSSEDSEVLALARSMGQGYALKRPDDLAGDLVPRLVGVMCRCVSGSDGRSGSSS